MNTEKALVLVNTNYRDFKIVPLTFPLYFLQVAPLEIYYEMK